MILLRQSHVWPMHLQETNKSFQKTEYVMLILHFNPFVLIQKCHTSLGLLIDISISIHKSIFNRNNGERILWLLRYQAMWFCDRFFETPTIHFDGGLMKSNKKRKLNSKIILRLKWYFSLSKAKAMIPTVIKAAMIFPIRKKANSIHETVSLPTNAD